MTVAVACNLSDGVILGVDSAVTVPAPGGVQKVYENAEKLFQLGERPIGVAVFGMASIGTRSIGSYIREFEVTEQAVSQMSNIEDIVEALRKFFYNVYKSTVIPAFEEQTEKSFSDIPPERRPAFGLAVGGFSEEQYLSEVWEIIIPHNDQERSATQKRGRGNFGTNWFAEFGPIQRYVLGFDKSLIDELLAFFEKLRGKPYEENELNEIGEIIRKHEYQIPFSAMPMREGVDHVRFLVELVINHHRYASGAPIVGGEAHIGMVTYRGEQFEILD